MVERWRYNQKILRNVRCNEKKKADAILASTHLRSPTQTPSKWAVELGYHPSSFWQEKAHVSGRKDWCPEAVVRTGSSLRCSLSLFYPYPHCRLGFWDLYGMGGVGWGQQCRDSKITFELELHCLQKGKMFLQCLLDRFLFSHLPSYEHVLSNGPVQGLPGESCRRPVSPVRWGLASESHHCLQGTDGNGGPCYHLLPR